MKPERGKSEAAALDELLSRLLDELREAQRRFVEGDDGGRAGACHALCAVSEFLRAFDEPLEEHLANLLIVLSNALGDLDDGVVAPMLRPAKLSGGPPETTARGGLRATAVVTLECLRKTGMSQTEAAKLVARELNRRGVRPLRGRRRGITAETVIYWRDDLSADHGTTFAAKVLSDMKSSVAVAPDAPPEEVRAELLQRLRFVALCFRAGDEGRTLADDARVNLIKPRVK